MYYKLLERGLTLYVYPSEILLLMSQFRLLKVRFIANILLSLI